jgi:endonuclease YncB( thermonuclease family)
MPQQYRVFRGYLHAVGLKPDGDTLAFKPHDSAALAALPGPDGDPDRVKFDADKNGAADVRLQGIDALETHYQPAVSDPRPPGATPPAGDQQAQRRQPSAASGPRSRRGPQPARDARVQVSDADWHPWGYLRHVTVGGVVVATKFQENVEIVVVAGAVEREGRVLGWVFPASIALAEGAVLTEAQLAALVKQSCNARLLAAGLAYPYYFMTLATALRGKLNTAVSAAQRAQRGVWAVDASAAGVLVPTLSALHDSVALWPYLFRKLLRSWRLAALRTYWSGGDVSSAALEALDVELLFASGNPYVYTVSDRQFLRLDEVVTVGGGVLKLKRKPQDIVFLE